MNTNTTPKLVSFPETHNTKILSTYFKYLFKQSALEVGVGDGFRSIFLSQLFNSYIGLEPNKQSFDLATQTCSHHNTKIQLINTTIQDFNTTTKFNVILFILVFHFLDDTKNQESMLNKCLDMLNNKGIVYIEEYKPVPDGRWLYDNFNITSNKFDKTEWNEKVNWLQHTKTVILNKLKTNTKIKVDYYDLEYYDIYVITKN